MKKAIVAALVLLAGFGVWHYKDLFLTGSLGVARDDSVGGKPVVKIGVSLPLSGDAAYVGEPAMVAGKLALKKWQDRDTKFNYELIFEDDQNSLKRGANVAAKFVYKDKVNALVSIWGMMPPIFMDVAKKENIINMSCTWGDGMFSDGVNNFNNITSDKHRMQKIVELVKRKGYKKVGMVMQKSSAEERLASGLKNIFAQEGIEVVFDEQINLDNRDFRTLFAKVKNSADIVIISTFPNNMNMFLKQKQEAGDQSDVTTIDYFDAVDMAFVEGKEYVGSAAATDEFAKEFAKHSEAHLGDCIANVYDDVDLLIYAFENAEAEIGEVPLTGEIAKILLSVKDWQGAQGILNTENNGHIESEAILKKIVNGKPVVVDSIM